VQVVDRDWLVRQSAFRFLEELSAEHGDVVPWRALHQGFEFDGARVTLLGARGIWKPATIELPISITTSWKDPYGDTTNDDGLLQYRYFGDDPAHPDNAGLRRCFAEGRPLVYFRAVDKGWYTAIWPLVLVHDDAASLTFTGACEDVEALRPGVTPAAADNARRRYVTRMAMVRLHQAGFRQRVLRAYSTRCTVCRLHHRELLDAAHILGDRHQRGEPVVRNGLSLCKIHHAAFDANILGIRPDHVVEIQTRILEERDGPMLRHGLQSLHGARLMQVPRRAEDRPARGPNIGRFHAACGTRTTHARAREGGRPPAAGVSGTSGSRR
jgi:putative restriction endonuclease